MFKAGELEAISMALEPQFRELEQRIMSDIVRRISINGEITRAADWQVTRLAQLGESKREIKKAIKDTLGLSTKEVNHLYKDVLRKGYERESELYKYKGRTQIPFAENHELQQLIGAVSDQTNSELKNITQSLGFAKRGADGKLTFTPVADYYQKTLDSAMLDISSGAFDYNTVLKRTVKEMTNSGLRSVDYATGHSNRVDVAARRALMTGMSQLTAKVNESNAEQLGTDMFETTAHGGARPEHQEWQGRWYTKDELESICGLGEVTGLCGANCYHDYYPVVPGISEPTYTAEQIEEFNRKENEPVEYNGKTYTKYEATQRQRKLETTMRAQRQEIKLLKEGGANEDDLIAARSRYRGTSAEYARFSKAMDLPQQRERVTVDGLGNIGQGKYKADTPSEAKQEAPQQTQNAQKGISPVEQNDATQGVTEAVTTPDNVNIELVDIQGESDIIEEGRMLFLNDLEDFENWQNEYYKANEGISFDREDNPNIYKYTGGSYEAINGVLRGGESLERIKRRYGSDFDQTKYEKIAEGVSEELSKFKLNETIELKRSVGDVDFITGASSSIEDMKNSIGKIYVEKGFSSSSVANDVYSPFAAKSPTRTTLEIVADKRYTRGAYIYKISEHSAEFEFLIDKNTAYKVLDAGEREIEITGPNGKVLRKENERYMRLLVIKND